MAVPKNFLRGRGKLVKAHIVALLSTTENSGDKFVFSINVTCKKIDQLTKKRAEHGFATHDCLMNTGKSPELELVLEDGKCKIKFEVKGALKPAHEIHPGEDVIEFSRRIEECEKIVVLSRNHGDTSTDAFIVFTLQSPEAKFLHRVCIRNVAIPEQGATTECKTTYASGGNEEVSPGLQAKPIPPRPFGQGDGPEPELGSSESAEDVEDNDDRRREEPEQRRSEANPQGDHPGMHTSLSTSSFRDTTPRGLVLSDASLNVISSALAPHEANQLFPILGVPENVSQQARRNNVLDVVQQHYEILRHWRHRHNEHGTDKMYGMLINGLSDIGRNDIKRKVDGVVAEGRYLKREDLEF